MGCHSIFCAFSSEFKMLRILEFLDVRFLLIDIQLHINHESSVTTLKDLTALLVPLYTLLHFDPLETDPTGVKSFKKILKSLIDASLPMSS